MPWRRSSPANKSIRGHISGPIPLPDPNDDEFPIRDPGVSMAVPLAAAGPEPPAQRVQRRRDSAWMDVPRPDHEPPPPLPVSAALPDLSPSPPRHSPPPPPNPVRHSANTTSTLAFRADSLKASPPRKKSAFRSALSKLFGRGKKNALDASTLSSTRTPRHHHQSDPIAENRPLKTLEPKRSVSLPVTEYDRALRSHSIGPQDVLAIQSARNSLLMESKRPPAKPYRALDLPPARPAAPHWAESKRFTGLSPRPASSHDRATRLADYSDDPNEIGRAITSDSHGLRRRSRSLSAFPVAEASATQGTTRRRSDEIRHWRDSYGPPVLSPDSPTDSPTVSPADSPTDSSTDSPTDSEPTEVAASARGLPDTAVEEPPLAPVPPFALYDDDAAAAAAASVKDAAEKPFALYDDAAVAAAAASAKDVAEQPLAFGHDAAAAAAVASVKNVAEPPFAFDDDDAALAKDMAEPPFALYDNAAAAAASVKDTAEPPNISQDATLDSRMRSLETRMRQLEHVVMRIGKSVSVFCRHPDPPNRQPPAPKPLKELVALSHLHAVHAIGGPRSPTRPPTRHSNASKATFGDGHSPLEPAPPAAAFPGPFSGDGPTSPSTIRGAASLPSMTKETANGVAMDHYMTLLGLLETERSARQALESQVRRLSHQITLATKAQGHAPRNPSDVPWTDASAGETPVFDDDDGGGGGQGPGLESTARALSLSRLTLGQHQLPPQAM